MYEKLEYKFDENDYPDPPKKDYSNTRKTISKNFPSFDFYNTVEDVYEKVGETKVIQGDPIDDLTDIILDLKEVKWCLHNTSEDDAKWHYKFSCDSHFGKHLIDLQYYLFHKIFI